jgi:hypothetical protein
LLVAICIWRIENFFICPRPASRSSSGAYPARKKKTITKSHSVTLICKMWKEVKTQGKVFVGVGNIMICNIQLNRELAKGEHTSTWPKNA